MNLKLKHKRLYALLVVLCLVLSVAVLLTACRNKNGDDGDDSGNGGQTQGPAYTGGAEQGEYYYDVANGEVLLTLTGGNFTLKGAGYDKSGTYSVDGTTLALDFANDEDGTATGTIAGDTISLVYNNATMTFLKKVTYTVTFSVDGGSAVAPVSVVNGKAATKPADPTKTGYAFLGWYTDSALTTGYAFTTPVKADITLYAKWLAVVADAPVYSVDFNLNYEGAPAVAGVETVNGIVYNFPADPTRTGYTFAGWWISMLEDGAKLSYQYTEGMQLTADTTLFALWDSNEKELASPKVNVSSTGIKWNTVPGATKYIVTVKDADGNLLREATSVTTTTFAYNFTNRDAGVTIFEVVATGTGTKVSDVAVRYYNNKALDRVSGLKIVDGKLIYNAVPNAEKYIITVDCGNKLHNHDALDNGNSTYYDFSNCSMQKGGIKFTVVAAAEGYASSVASKTLAFEQNLAPVASVTYNGATDSFEWAAVANATQYKVALTVGANTYAFKTSATSFSLANYTGAISVSVTPVADGYNSPDAATASATKTAPAAVQNLAMSNTTLTWSATADSYKITINGTTYTTTETTYDLASKLAELALQAGETYTVSVVAVAGGEESAAATVSAVNGAMSQTLTYSDKVVSWPAVVGASNFQVKVNGGEAITVTGKTYAAVTLTKAGENVIEVLCTDLTTDWTNASKITVTAYEVKYVTLTTDRGEVTEYLAVGDTLTAPTGMTFSGFNFGGWYNTPNGANDNGKEYTEATLVSAANLTLYTNWIPKSYKVTLNVDETFISNLANGSTEDVTYTKDFKLPVPVSTDESKGFFVGWFNAPNGGGIQMTDDLGNSIAPYNVIGDSSLYPFFAEILSYVEVKDKETDALVGYYANKGLGITNRNVSAVVIPATYNGKPIIGIADNAFHSCYNIKSVSFPNTVEYVGKGAFELCNSLVSIDMYEVDPNSETPYSTHDGALMCYYPNALKTYLEVFPSAKVGEYTVSDKVDVIGPGAFQNARISKVIISKNVTSVSKNAFMNCAQLTEIEFEFERTTDVTIEDGAFADTPNVTTIKLPAKLAVLENIKVFDVFEDLSYITVEPGGANYSSKDNLICDPFGTKLLYVPRSFRGTFEVPLGIKTIDDKLFYNNPYITKVIIGEHVERIGADAFNGCTALAEVVVKTPRESLFTIDANAFYRCSNLKKLVIEGSDTTDANENCPIYIGDNAFAQCSKLNSVEIGKNAVVFEIGSGAFQLCTALESFSVDATAKLVTIGSSAFRGCSVLASFEIHGTTETVGNSAFEGCVNLSTLSIGEGTNRLALGKDVFKDCVSLVTINLPSSLTAFDSSILAGCTNIQDIVVADDNPFLESHDGVLYTKGLTEIIYFPRTREITDGVVDLSVDELKSLKKIGPAVFYDNPKVKTVKLGAGIEEIAKGAFEKCINLTKVEFTGTNTTFTLGAYAFKDCTNLTAITLPAATTAIGSMAFDHTALASFTLPASTTYIGYGAFGYTNLTSFTVTDKVTFIGHAAFFNATKLASVNFDPRTADLEIGKWDDQDGKNSGIDLEVRNGVFAGTALTSVSLPASTTYVGPYAFEGLTTLGTLTIPADARLVTIDDYAFQNTSISNVILNNNITTIGNYAFAGTKLTTVNVPKSVQYIKSYAFSIPTLTSITFEEGSAEGIGLHISNFALAGANLTSINLPIQLKAFGEVDEYGFSAISVFYELDARVQTQNGKSYRYVSVKFSGNENLTTITVTSGNTVYGVVDGVLYKLKGVSKGDDMVYQPDRLLFSPVGNLGNNGTVTVPKTVTVVDYTSFLRTQLTQIIFEEYDKTDANYGQGKLVIGWIDSAETRNLYPAVVSPAYDKTKPGNDKNYTNLELIKFPSHLTAIRNGSFYGFNPYTLDSNGKAMRDSKLAIEFNPDSTVKFVAGSLRGCSAIKSIKLPKISYIGQDAFYQLYGVTDITFANEDALSGSTLTDIGYRAFADCSELTSFVVPASVKTISDNAFYGCAKLTSFTVADGSDLISVGNQAFYRLAANVEGGIKFVIPATVKAVGTKAFYGANITELTLSEHIVLGSTVGGSLIEGCTTIQKINVPEAHETLSSFEGIVYDKNKTAIYLIPSNWSGDEFILPDTVQVIAPGTFEKFKASYIKLPAALTEIGAGTFREAEITRIEIPDNVVTIGANAFQDCKKLATITITNNSKLTTIGTYAFSYTAITEINLPKSLSEIGTFAFNNCRSLTSINIPANVATLPNQIFNHCEMLQTVTLNEGLDTIGNGAFKYCYKLSEILIPNSVKHINEYAFHDCKALKSFTCMESSQLISIGFSCFLNCESLETVTLNTTQTKFTFFSNTNGKYETFKGCTNLKVIKLPDTLKDIPDGLFMGVTDTSGKPVSGLPSLETITLPKNLETIGIQAFWHCPKLTTIVIPASVETIGNAAFAECSALTTVEFEQGSKLSILDANVFAKCTSLATINLPEALIAIGDGAFAMTGFTTITLPAALYEIGITAFYGCEKLTEINVPASVSVIGREAFADCSELASVTLNSGLTNIGGFAFANCEKLEAITIPDTVNTLSDNPFLGCKNLVLTLAAGNNKFVYEGGVLLDKPGLTLIYYSPKNTAKEYTIPSTVVTIRGGAFSNSQLETITLHERISVLSSYVFAYSESLKNLVIPASVTKIEDAAFVGCSSIESITIPASVDSLGNYAFANCTSLANFTLAERKDNITVGSHLFYGCKSITKTYDFPGVKEFTPYMYAGTGITSFTFADNTNYNVPGVFANSALTSVTFGKLKGTMETLGEMFFAGSKLTSVTLPAGFTTIRESAFANCKELISVTLYANEVYASAFENCTKLANVTFGNQVTLHDRVFANDTALSNTNLFEFVYSYGVEALLNCSAISGEISLSSRVNGISDYAFSGMTVSKITVNGREYYLNAYSFAGLTEATTVYFSTATSADAINERMGTNTGWENNTNATLEFYAPNSGEVEVTLTEEEIKTLELYVKEGMIAEEKMDAIKEVWLAYKASFTTLYPADSLTKDEIKALDEFANNCKISEKLRSELEKMWLEYRMTLAKELTKHPKYFTDEELNSFNELAGKMDEATQNAFKQAWFEYKIAYNDTNPSAEISKEDQEAVMVFCKEIGLGDDFAKELITRWPDYKKQLAAALIVPVYIDLTPDELKALEAFCEKWEIKVGFDDLKTAWMLYKGSFTIAGKEDSESLNADEEALIDAMIATYALEPKAAQEFKDSLLRYKQTYAKYFETSIPLTEKDNKLVDELAKSYGLEESALTEIREALLAYKKNFCLSGFVPDKKGLSAEEEAAFNDFISKYNLKASQEFVDRFIEYRATFAQELGRM